MSIKTLRVCDMRATSNLNGDCFNSTDVETCSICNRDYCPSHSGGYLSISASAARTFGHVDLLQMCVECINLSRKFSDEDGLPDHILRSIGDQIIEAFKAALAAHTLAADKKP